MTQSEQPWVFNKISQAPLQYLGAATVEHWNDISAEVRSKIQATAEAGAFVGLPPITGLSESIRSLINKKK